MNDNKQERPQIKKVDSPSLIDGDRLCCAICGASKMPADISWWGSRAIWCCTICRLEDDNCGCSDE